MVAHAAQHLAARGLDPARAGRAVHLVQRREHVDGEAVDVVLAQQRPLPRGQGGQRACEDRA